MKIINNGQQVTPYRLLAALRLIAHLGECTREQFLRLLQPEFITYDTTASEYVLQVAVTYGLVYEENRLFHLHPELASDTLADFESYRRMMHKRLWQTNYEDEDDYRLSLYTAWYAVQNEKAFEYNADTAAQKFVNELKAMQRDELAAMTEGKLFNETKVRAWNAWAQFLGVAWAQSQGNASILIPDAYWRLRYLLPQLLSPDEEEIAAAVFMERLSEHCPELDGGVLFEMAWQDSRPHEQQTHLSLMLSNALHGLHRDGILRLITYADASESIVLYPTELYPSRISSLTWGENAWTS
jgi:hypothetical protein